VTERPLAVGRKHGPASKRFLQAATPAVFAGLVGTAERRAVSKLSMPRAGVAANLVEVCLGDGQGEGLAGSSAGAAEVARVSARSIDLHAGGAGGGDYGGCDRGLHLLIADYVRGQRCSVDDDDRGRNKLSAIHGEKKARLNLSERNRVGGKRTDVRTGAGASAQRVERIAALEDQHGQQNHAEKAQGSTNWSHRASYHATGQCRSSSCCTGVTRWPVSQVTKMRDLGHAVLCDRVLGRLAENLYKWFLAWPPGPIPR
jgi:hypothetical protein